MKDPIVRAQHYRDQAAKLRAMSEKEPDLKSQKDLLALAIQYDKLVVELLEHAVGRSLGLN